VLVDYCIAVVVEKGGSVSLTLQSQSTETTSGEKWMVTYVKFNLGDVQNHRSLTLCLGRGTHTTVSYPSSSAISHSAMSSVTCTTAVAVGRCLRRIQVRRLATTTTSSRCRRTTVLRLSASKDLSSSVATFQPPPADLFVFERSSMRMMSSSGGGGTNDDKETTDDVGKLISGLTQDRVDSDPEVRAYVEANYPSVDDGDDDSSSTAASSSVPNHGINLPDELLKEFGVTDEEMEEMMSSATKSKQSKAKLIGDDGRPIDLGLGTAEQQRLNIRVLKSYTRSVEGSRVSESLREDHKMIPGLLYGSDPYQQIYSYDRTSRTLLQTPWSELQRELDRYHRHFESRVYDLTIYEDGDDGETPTAISTHRVVPRNVQHHPVMGKIYCANFLRYHPKRPLKIPLTYINVEESPALKRDGYIIPVNKFVECFVEDGVPIPDSLEVECTGLVLKDVVKIDRIIFPDGVRYTDRTDIENFIVGPVKGGRSTAGDDDDDADGGGDGSTGEAAA
jgi:Ribosomal L25p family